MITCTCKNSSKTHFVQLLDHQNSNVLRTKKRIILQNIRLPILEGSGEDDESLFGTNMMIDCRRKWPLWRPGWRQLCRNLIIVIPKVFGFLAFFQKTKWRRKWLLALFEIKVEGFCWKKNWILFKTIVTSPLAWNPHKGSIWFLCQSEPQTWSPHLKFLNCPFPIVSFFSDCKKAIEPQNNWTWPWRRPIGGVFTSLQQR